MANTVSTPAAQAPAAPAAPPSAAPPASPPPAPPGVPRVPGGMRPAPVVDDGGGLTAPPGAPAAPAQPTPPPPVGSKAAAALQRLRAERAAKEQHQAQMTAELARVRAQAEHEARARAEAESRAKAGDERFERVKGDPYALLAEAGVDVKDVIERAKSEADPVKQLERRLEEYRKAHETLVKQTEERAEQDRQARAAAEARAGREQREGAFLTAAKDAKQFAIVAETVETHGERFVISAARALIADIHAVAKARGEPPPIIPDHELLAYLNGEWAKKRAARTPAAGNADPASTTSTAPTAGDTRTPITDETASERASMPADVSKMTKAQQNAYFASVYRKHKKPG